MTSFEFYNYSDHNFVSTLTDIITKIYESNKSIVVRTTTDTNMNYLDSLLWNFNPASFIPHAKSGDATSSETPVYLTTGKEVANNAKVLILVNGAQFFLKEVDSFNQVIVIFCKKDPESINEARNIWQIIKCEEFNKQYWLQNGTSWIEKNTN